MQNPLTVKGVIALYTAARPGITSDDAWRDVLRLLTLFQGEHGELTLTEAIPYTLANWLGSHPEWESDWTRARVVRTVQRPFNWALKNGLIPRNPFYGFSVPPGCAGRAMTEEEFARAIRWAKPPFARILTFLRLTGARPCEARALLWEQVDPETGTATLLRHKTQRSRRDRAPRVIMLSDSAVELLVEVLEKAQTHTGHVFLNSRGNPWTKNAFALQMQRLKRRGKLPKDCKLYGLRHRFGTLAAESGLDIKAISELMGHTTVRMTEHYVHVSGKAKYLRGALGRVSGL